jgi:hypothetical protein
MAAASVASACAVRLTWVTSQLQALLRQAGVQRLISLG